MRIFLFVALTLAAFAEHALAHHGIGAEYDMKQSVTVTGTSEVLVVPFPSSPKELSPQHSTLPLDPTIAQAWS